MASAIYNDNPVSVWIEELRANDQDAARKLWNHFFVHLKEAVVRKISLPVRATYDEEDAALSAFNSFCNGINAGRFPDVKDRTSLWRLLLVIAGRKITERVRHEHRDRRDQRRTIVLSMMFTDDSSQSDFGLPSGEPSPEFVAEFEETVMLLFGTLTDPTLVTIAQAKLEGFRDHEIAEQTGYSERTIRRKMERIRRLWIQDLDPEDLDAVGGAEESHETV